MSEWVVGFCSLYDNELILEKVEAETFKGAVQAHSKLKSDDMAIPEELKTAEEILQYFWDQDILLNAIKL